MTKFTIIDRNGRRMTENTNSKKSYLLLSEDGKSKKVVTSQELYEIATELDLDILKFNDMEQATVKILDFSKYKYELDKQRKANNKATVKTKVKETKLSMRISDHDLEIKANRTKDFIKKGDKVIVSIQLRGRERTLKHVGITVMEKFLELVSNVATVESKGSNKISLDGNRIIMNLKPL